MKVSNLLTTALVSGLLAGSATLSTLANDEKAAPTSADNSFVPKEKHEAKGKTKKKKHHDMKEKDGCNSKEGCHAVDKKEEAKKEAAPEAKHEETAPAKH